MKAFKDISINDEIIKIRKRDNLMPEITVIKINFIRIKGYEVLFNKTDDYSARYELTLPVNSIKDSIFHTEKYVYVVNKADLNDILRDCALKLIDKHENQIIEIENKIKKVREDYYDYLNPKTK